MILTSRNFEEKRSFIRMRVDTPVTISCDAKSGEIKGVCRDLSGGGLMVEVDSALPVGAELEICIASQHGHSPMLKARAQVSRVSTQLGNENKPCLVGLEIVEMLQ